MHKDIFRYEYEGEQYVFRFQPGSFSFNLKLINVTNELAVLFSRDWLWDEFYSGNESSRDKWGVMTDAWENDLLERTGSEKITNWDDPSGHELEMAIEDAISEFKQEYSVSI